MQIAIYGKGGIGKSTISANLSAALAVCGGSVLQIGCDPKHDSTRLLCHGQKVRTVLDYLLNTPADDQKLADVPTEGYRGVGCVEAGGPRPGMGCAGRGILTAFDFLNRFHALSGYDQIIYDVLGDVVCGGFAVPVRKQYADAVFLVTSGESMALYAANNILQGIRNLTPNADRIGGIIYNSRGIGDEPLRVMEFASLTGLPVCARVPRSEAFARAEQEAVTVVEKDPESAESAIFLSLARQIAGGLRLYEARPMDEEQMERFMRGETVCAYKNKTETPVTVPVPALPSASAGTPVNTPFVPPKKRALSDPFGRVPLYGCAYHGALALAIHVRDAAVLGHAPGSCTWIAIHGFTGYPRRGLYERGILYPAFLPRHFENTDITMQDAVFGGVEHARQKALGLVKQGVKTIIAVTACIPGLSGDDLTPFKKELKALGCELYIIHADGVEAGDYDEGMALCYQTLAKEAVYETVEPDKNSINIVYEHTISSRTDSNFQVIEDILKQLGIHVNCRFVCATTIEDIHHFLKAPYSIMARSDRLGQELQTIFEQKYGCRFLEGNLPAGFRETACWVEMIGAAYGRQDAAVALIEKHRKIYLERIAGLRPTFRGKRAVIFLNSGVQDWLSDLTGDLEINVVRTIFVGKREDSNPGWNRRFSGDWACDRKDLETAIKELAPDLVLHNDAAALPDMSDVRCVVDLTRETRCGFYAGVENAEKWLQSAESRIEGRWKYDRPIFEKCYC